MLKFSVTPPPTDIDVIRRRNREANQLLDRRQAAIAIVRERFQVYHALSQHLPLHEDVQQHMAEEVINAILATLRGGK
jgi:hypothetical protein